MSATKSDPRSCVASLRYTTCTPNAVYKLSICLFVIVNNAQCTEAIDLGEYWNPKLYVDNCVGEPKETISRSVVYDVNTWEAFIVERRRLKGTFLENLELFHFPFDTQV